MFLSVLTCIRQEHDLRFVALAALICVVAAMATFGFYRRARASSGGRFAWIAFTGPVGGSGIWATHFIAMLAYEPSLNIHYDLALTALSWVAAVVGVGAGFALAAWRPGLIGRLVGGVLAGLAIGAMHFLGMAAVRLSGEVLWRPNFVVASIVIGAVGAAAALAAADERGGVRRRLLAPGLFVVAIVGLHFTAMTAAIILPSNAEPLGPSLIGRGPMAVAVSVLTAFIFAAAGGLVWMERFAKGATLSSVRAALDALPSGVAFFDSSGRLLAWNAALRQMLKGGEPLRPRMTFDEVQALTEAAGALPQTAMDARALRAEMEAGAERGLRESRLSDGRWMRLEAQRTPDGGTVIVITDTTDANLHAEALAAARDQAEAASRAKSEFLANMSHEIRTPLNGVLGIAEALSRTPLTARQAEMLSIVRESGETLDALLGDILDMARVESGAMSLHPEPVRVADLCASVAALFADRAREKGLELVCQVEPDADVRVLADPLRLRQILTNLVSNAVKFTEAGEVRLTASRSGGRLRLQVSDTGPGFDASFKARLFERFGGQADGSATRAHGGAGLGLPLCGRLAALMGAAFDAEATPGMGARFWIEAGFPLAEAPVAPEAPPETDGERPPKVLVVDDNAVNRQVLEMILDSAGVDHEAAANGLEAVERVSTGAFDAVLMDIQMPVMDGLEATRRIREWEGRQGGAHRPIFIVSANCMPEHVAAGRAAGADGHIAKPVSAAKVLTALTGEAA